MNKLTRMLFGPRPVARETISARPAEARIPTIPSRRRERLISSGPPIRRRAASSAHGGDPQPKIIAPRETPRSLPHPCNWPLDGEAS